MKKIHRLPTALAASALLSTPFVAFAAGIDTTALDAYKTSFLTLVNTILVPVIIGLAFITFLWGLYKYFILGAAEEGEKAEGRKYAMWGIIGFVVILSVWGLVNLVTGVLNLDSSTTPKPPTFKTQTAAP